MLIKENVWITPYKLERTLHICLPDDYHESDRRYPVMYMYDGHNLFLDEDATYGKSWGLAEYIKDFPRQMIIVGLECNHEGSKRLEEFCPYPFRDFDGTRVEGTGQILMEWMSTELKAYIDSHFRTLPDRANTGIGGSSMGGLMAVYSVVRHNDVYSRAACLSSAFTFCWPAIKKLVTETPALDPDTRIYLSWGSKESGRKPGLVRYTNANLTLAHLLTMRGALTYPYLQVYGGHCEADWEKQNPVYMPFLWE